MSIIKKRIAIIGSAGVPCKYGGFETVAHQLCLALNQKYYISVFCSNKYYKKSERVKIWNNCRMVYLPLNANGFQSIPYDIISFIYSLFIADIFLVLGVSGAIMIPFIKLISKKKIYVNIDGLEWKRAKWNGIAKFILKYSEKIAVKYADKFIVDNQGINIDALNNHNKTGELIEYGADHVILNLKGKILNNYDFMNDDYIFKVARIEPENNIDMILEAFSKMPNVNFVLVGNWMKSTYGINLKSKFSSYSNLYLLEPIYDQNTLDTLRSNCSLYIHGHSAGGTNPSLIEAMYLELPIICYDVIYNRESTENKSQYFSNSDTLINIVSNLNKEKLSKLAFEMKEIADRRYTWRIISEKHSKLFENN